MNRARLTAYLAVAGLNAALWAGVGFCAHVGWSLA
jgi:hypothetical protein